MGDTSVTQNRRYQGHNIGLSIEEAVVRPAPIGLTDAELDLEHHPITEPETPLLVRAWVRFHEATIQPECEAVAWTDKAVRVRWRMQNGQMREAWVWANAVERLQPKHHGNR